jgi:hypothetical protein
MNARRSTLTAFASLGALTVALLLWSVPALAARGHVFSTSFAGPCIGPGGTCEPGQLKEPAGVAVNEATGDVYVVDKATNLVTEFDEAGGVVGTFGNNGPGGAANGQLMGSSGMGTGTLTVFGTGSGTLHLLATGIAHAEYGRQRISIETTTGSFAVGEEIAGTGIEAGTTITKVEAGVLEISDAIGACGVGCSIRAASREVTGLTTASGEFAVGEGITGAGIEPGSTITAVGPGNTLELSTLPTAGGEAALRAGSYEVSELAATAGAFSVGQEISGDGIPAGTTITAVNALTKSLVLSQLPTASGLMVLTASRPFSEPESIAVDNSCSLRKLTEATTPTCKAADPSNGDVYVDAGQGVVDKFSANGVFVNQLEVGNQLEGGRLVGGVGVDPRGELFVLVGNSADALSNSEANEPLPSIPVSNGELGSTEPGDFAVDSDDDLYVTNESSAKVVYEDSPKGCQFNGVCEGLLNKAVDTEPSSGLATEPSSNDVYVDNIGTLARFGPEGIKLESLTVPGGGGTGVAVKLGPSEGSTVYVADAATGKIEVFDAEPAGPPTVEAEEVLKVTGDSARLEAKVNPRSEAKEQGTKYDFEYTSEAQFQREGFTGATSVPGGLLAANFTLDTVSPVEAQGLSADTTYHFRVVAENEHDGRRYVADGERNESGEEVVHTFTTQTPGGFTLPDGRQWEMVSPADKHGAIIVPSLGSDVIQAAAGGDAMTYETSSPTESEPLGYATAEQVLSTRGPAGWESRDIDPPQNIGTGVTADGGQQYRFFSEDLSFAILQPFGAFVPCTDAQGAKQPCLSEAATEQTVFVRDDVSGMYEPLVTRSNDTATPFQPFGEEGDCPNVSRHVAWCGPVFADASPDGKSIALRSRVPLVEGAPPNSLYEWSDGELKLITGEEGAIGNLGFYNNEEAGRHAISNDGSRVFWTGPPEHHLHMTDMVDGKSIELDAGLKGAADFQAASSDGSRVFFTVGSAEGRGGPGGELYVCEIGEGAGGEPECELTDLTPGAEIEGSVIVGASEDGSYVYFVSDGALAPGAQLGPGTRSTTNLYMTHDAGGRWETTLVATLSTRDSADFPGGLGALTARVSPDGRWLAFMSQRELTGYDNHDAVSGMPDEEVYLYHAPETPATESGTLVCASCNPTGARPIGVEYGGKVGGASEGKLNGGPAGGSGVWPESTWLAANVPGWASYRPTSPLYQSRYLSNSGRLFFNARDPLVAQAVNGKEDVYEYEPVGVGNCEGAGSSTGSRAFEPARAFEVEGLKEESGAGCVGLISSGESADEAGFVDASESGGDVFFLTTAKLVPQDYDTLWDVYDAHECTSAAPCLPVPAAVPPPCDTEASCKAAPALQPEIFGAPSSETFSGAGNITPPAPVVVKPKAKPAKCKKSFVKKKNQCVRRKKVKKGTKAKKAGNNGRASR